MDDLLTLSLRPLDTLMIFQNSPEFVLSLHTWAIESQEAQYCGHTILNVIDDADQATEVYESLYQRRLTQLVGINLTMAAW